MMMMRYVVKTSFAALACSGLLISACAAHATEVVPRTLDQTAHDAAAIVGGKVLKADSHWADPQHRCMETDYTIALEDVVVGNGLRAGMIIQLTYWGGTIGQQSQHIADVNLPELGHRYVWMLRPEWQQKHTYFTPVIGMFQGLFPVSQDASGVTSSEGTPLTMTQDQRVIVGRESQKATNTHNVTYSTFLRWLHTNLMRIQQLPPTPMPDRDPTNAMALYGKKPAADLTAREADLLANPVMPETPDLGPAPIPRRPHTQEKPSFVHADVQRRNDTPRPNYVTRGHRSMPTVVNQLPPSLAPWAPEDQYAMSRWNYYVDMFRVEANPSGTFGWPNGTNDIDGFVDNGTLFRVYLRNWASDELAVTIDNDFLGFITESDVAFNPGWVWTLDDSTVWAGAAYNPQSFRSTMQHELGHVVGMAHNFEDLAIMNYSPSIYRAYAMPYMDDLEGVRSLYRDHTVTVTDLGVYLYKSISTKNWGQAIFPVITEGAKTFTITKFHIENVGTEVINTPQVLWYATKKVGDYTDPYYYIGISQYGTPLAEGTHYDANTIVASFTFPSTVPEGSYFLHGYVYNDAGGFSFPFSNNYAWSSRKFRVNASFVSLTANPTVIAPGGTGSLTLTMTNPPTGQPYIGSYDPVITSPGNIAFASGQNTATVPFTAGGTGVPKTVLLNADYTYYDLNGLPQIQQISTQVYVTAPATLTVGAATGIPGQMVPVTATFTRTSDNLPLAGKSIDFTIGGVYAGSATTDANGVATIYTIVPAGTPTVPISASFAGDSSYQAATGQGTLMVKIVTLDSINPTQAPVGSGNITLTLTGNYFGPKSSAFWNGTTQLATTYVSPTQLTAVLPASLLSTAGAFGIAVSNPALHGGNSKSALFVVGNPSPTLTSLSPASVVEGSPDTTVLLNGTNFVTGATASLGNTNLATTFVSSTQLSVVIPASLLTYAHSASITVTNHSPSAGASAPLTFTVAPGSTTLALVSNSANRIDRITGGMQVIQAFQNTGSYTARNIQITSAQLAGTGSTLIVPASAFNLSKTGTYPLLIKFPAGAAAIGSTPTLTVTYTSDNAGSGTLTFVCGKVH